MWRPEVNSGYLPHLLSALFFEIGSLIFTQSSPILPGKLASKPQGSSYLHSPLLGLQARATMPGFFAWVQRIELRSWCLHGKCFTNWSITLASKLSSNKFNSASYWLFLKLFSVEKNKNPVSPEWRFLKHKGPSQTLHGCVEQSLPHGGSHFI